MRFEAELDWHDLAQRLGSQLDATVVARPRTEGTNGGTLVVDGSKHVELITEPGSVGVVSYGLSSKFLEWATISALQSPGGEFEGEVPVETLVTLAEHRRRSVERPPMVEVLVKAERGVGKRHWGRGIPGLPLISQNRRGLLRRDGSSD